MANMVHTLTVAWMRNGHILRCARQTAQAAGNPQAVAALQCLCPDGKHTARSRTYRRVIKALSNH